jgi:hypothetical protein
MQHAPHSLALVTPRPWRLLRAAAFTSLSARPFDEGRARAQQQATRVAGKRGEHDAAHNGPSTGMVLR